MAFQHALFIMIAEFQAKNIPFVGTNQIHGKKCMISRQNF